MSHRACALQIAATVLFNGGTIYFLLSHFGLIHGGAHAGNPDMILTPPSSDDEAESDGGAGTVEEGESAIASLCALCRIIEMRLTACMA